MNYFPFHIGDFDRATRHLTRIERSIYIDLMLMYYDTERALVHDMAVLCRKVVARSDEEKAAVEAILQEFFIDTPTGWFHERCEEVLAEYRNTKTQASEAGKASAKARAERRAAALASAKTTTPVEQNANEIATTVQRPFNDRSTTVGVSFNDSSTEGQRSVNEQATEGQPTNNQEPKPITKTRNNKSAPPGGDADLFPDVDPKVVEDFKKVRKAKRAAITQTAMDDIAAEAVKAGLTLEGALRVCCARGWQGFKAEWIQSDRRQSPANGAGHGTKFNLAGIDHSSTRAAAEASREKHGIVIPDGDDDIKF